ncbi:MAG TPA: aspartate dehydrogenase [Nitrolancea sp.]|nr:aspartate dehydrogenase [Nitrolancea sp.]
MAGGAEPQRVGLIGLGAIGRSLANLAAGRDDLALVGALVRDTRKDRGVAVPVVSTLAELLALGPEVVVEIAGHEGLRQHGAAALRAGYDLIAVSVGALADPALQDELLEAAQASGRQVKVASGAIGALDAIAAARLGGLERVTHTTRKPATTLLGAEGATLREPRELFRGPARAAVVKFPESVNVAAAVSLAGLGLDRTEVCVIADPAVERNQHVVEVEGAFGRLRFEIAGIPSGDNPKTGRIVAMSILHTILMRRAPLVVG